MLFADARFAIHGSPAQMLSVHLAKQRLFADRIYLAQAARLRQTFFFARWKFRGYLHSLFLKGAGLAAGSFGPRPPIYPRPGLCRSELELQQKINAAKRYTICR